MIDKIKVCKKGIYKKDFEMAAIFKSSEYDNTRILCINKDNNILCNMKKPTDMINANINPGTSLEFIIDGSKENEAFAIIEKLLL